MLLVNVKKKNRNGKSLMILVISTIFLFEIEGEIKSQTRLIRCPMVINYFRSTFGDYFFYTVPIFLFS